MELVTDEAKHLLESMLKFDSAERISAEQALKHKWFDQLYEIKKDNVSKDLFDKTLKNLQNVAQNEILLSQIMSMIVYDQQLSAEKKLYAQVFDQLDANKDGILTKDELMNGYMRIHMLTKEDA